MWVGGGGGGEVEGEVEGGEVRWLMIVVKGCGGCFLRLFAY